MRFFVSPEYIFPDEKRIDIRDKEELHHIKDVMRLKAGSRVTVFDGLGKEYTGVINNIGSKTAEILIEKTLKVNRESLPEIALYQAIPKKSKIDIIIEKCVELGVTKVVPVITERTIPGLKESKKNKVERWNRIAMAASKQCGRTVLPEVTGMILFDKALDLAGQHDIVIFCALHNEAIPLKTVLKRGCYGSIGIFVGPEGDFSLSETEEARKKGYPLCSLGGNVLRVETAAIYLLSCLNYEYHD